MNDLSNYGLHGDLIEQPGLEHVGAAAAASTPAAPGERIWDGRTITEPGLYRGISLADYHGNRDLFDGPSVSKSVLKWLLPVHGGSPKAFWGRWAWNPNRVEPETSKALDFGKATHALLLGDEVFADAFAVQPDKAPDGRAWHHANASCRAWTEAQGRKTIITLDQFDRIARIRADAVTYPMIQLGALDGRVERTLALKDQETGIWLRARPDAMPESDGMFADLKTAGKFDEDFLEQQVADASYYLQAAITRMVCRGLGIPFETFVLIYVLNDDVPDTAHVEVDEVDIDRGERVVRWCLRTIRRCLDAGEWPGARPFNDGSRRIQMKVWAKDRIDNFLDREEKLGAAA